MVAEEKIAVVLSGCGVFDGSEIYETVLTLLRLEQKGVRVQCFAPDKLQAEVVNHLTGEPMPEDRNILVEAARIVRGEVLSLDALNPDDFAGLIIPGGFGAAKNLSDFASQGARLTVDSGLMAKTQGFIKAAKPIGLICIAPAMAAKLFGSKVSCTIGSDSQTAQLLEQTGIVHINAEVGDIVIDTAHKLVSTPAYMLAKSITEAQTGIFKLVDQVLQLI